MIHRIADADDGRIAAYAHVGDAGWLRDRGLFVAEGRFVVQRLIDGGRFRVVSALVTPAAFAALERHLAAAADVYVARQEILNGVTGFNFHRGCLALAERGAESALPREEARLLVALEGVGNPDNIGGIFRSAAAFGVDAIALDPACGDPLYRKSVRTSMGAVLAVPFVRLRSWPGELREVAAGGASIVGLTPRGAMTLDELARNRFDPGRLILVAGAEGPGLTDAALELCQAHVRIPIDPRADSLNVVVAVSIALHALRPVP